MIGDASVAQQTCAFLTQLVRQEEGLIGALLASPDGLLVADHLPPSDRLEKIAAMSTALHALGREIGAALVLGEYRALRVRFQNGEVYLISVGDHTLVLAAARELEPAVLETFARQAAEQFACGTVP